MKKILSLILTIILALPIFVKADMGAPTIKGYEAIISNVNGVVCRDFSTNIEETIPYDTKIKINYEEVGNVAYIDYNGKSCEISIKNIKPFEKVYNLNDSEKLENLEEALVVNKNGVEIYNGPSSIYEKIGTIPYNTKLNFQYILYGDEGGGILWLYVESNGLKGWISTLEGHVVIKGNELFILKDTDFYNENDEKIATIPKFTTIKDFYNYSPYAEHESYFTYKGINGYINSTLVGTKLEKEKTIILENEEKLIEEVWSEEEKILATIPKATTLEYTIYTDDYNLEFIYVTYKGISGWITLGDEPYDEEPITTEPVKDTTTPTQKVETESTQLSGREVVILCVVASILLALTITVIIILINKKKTKTVEPEQIIAEPANNEK